MKLEYRPDLYRGDKRIYKAHWGFSSVGYTDDATRRLLRTGYPDRDAAVTAAHKAKWLVCDDNSCISIRSAA